jgi:anthranilate synthase/aminodeoxychorismate synthase-like glutamine amidotransferase
MEIVTKLGKEYPILGVCLGHQAMAQALGARIVRGPEPIHGKTSEIHHDGLGVYQGLANPFEATRYHSLVVDPSSLPRELKSTARTQDGIIMGLRHRHYPLEGVQFHPESILTRVGKALLHNFLLHPHGTRLPMEGT